MHLIPNETRVYIPSPRCNKHGTFICVGTKASIHYTPESSIVLCLDDGTILNESIKDVKILK